MDKRKRYGLIFLLGIILSIMICFITEGTSGVQHYGDKVYTSMRENGFDVSEKYYIYNILEGEHTEFFCKNKENGERQNIIRDIFNLEMQQDVENMQVVDDYVYYMKVNEQQSQVIYRTNLKTFENEEIYTGVPIAKKIKLFGIILWSQISDFETYSDNTVRKFFIGKDKIILVKGGCVTAYDGEHEKVIIENPVSEITYCKGKIYYTNELGEVYLYDMEKDETKCIENILASVIYATNEGVLYIDMIKPYNLKLYDSDANKEVIVYGRDDIVSFDISEKYIWILTDSELFGYDKNTKKIEFEQQVQGNEVYVISNRVYLEVYNNDTGTYEYKEVEYKQS